jgi:hypothetical protein
MTMDTIRDPSRIADRGEEIYREKYKTAFEEEHPGKFVAIDVMTGHAYIGNTPEEAYENARTDAPQGVFHLIRVGYTGAFRVSRSTNASHSRLFR